MLETLEEAKQRAARLGPSTPSPSGSGKARRSKLRRDSDDDHSPIDKRPPVADRKASAGAAAEPPDRKASAAAAVEPQVPPQPQQEAQPRQIAQQRGSGAVEAESADMDADSPLQLEVDDE